MKKIYSTVLIVLGVIAAVVFIINRSSKSKYDKVEPKVGEIIEAVYGLGKVKTSKQYQVKLGVISTVQTVFVKEGDSVKKGQKLLALDSGTLFRAPFDGTITFVNIHDGETAGTQNAIITLADLNERFIELVLEQAGALRIKKGQAARITFETTHRQSLVGRVTAIYPREDEFITVVSLDNLEQSILPGMSADVAIEIGKINGTTIPLKAINNGQVLVERANKIQKIKVDIGLIDGLSAEVKNNSLQETDLVLVPKE